MFIEHTPDNARIDALQHLDNSALGTSAPIQPGDTHDDAIPVEHLAHILGSDENIVAAFIAAQKAETIWMPLDPPGDQIGLVRQQPGIAAIEQQLPLAQHRAQPPLESLALAVENVERPGERVELHRHPLAREDLPDVFAAG